ncbi:MAG: hypothetical protein AAGF13_10700, partial [Pseudomonadota bacterium]
GVVRKNRPGTGYSTRPISSITLGPIWATMADVPAELGEFIQPDGVHPSAAGIEAIVAHMGPSVIELIGRVE